MSVKTDTATIETLLYKGTVDLVVKENLQKKLESGKPLRIKFGIDPTGSDIHIGHAVPLRKLKQFQNAGHQIIFLIGDYTAKIGDPSGRTDARPILSDEKIQENMKYYLDQAGRIFDLKKTEVRYNSEWFAKITMGEILQITGTKTVAQILQRKDFKQRLQDDVDISMSELLYPIMQGYDSVALKADIEIGGTDQLFNLLTGRDIQKKYNQPIQDVLTVPILEGLDGKEKMSKSLKNYIAVKDLPNDMYGKTMSIPDALILKYFELTTDYSLDDIKKIKELLDAGENPRNLKMRLGRELVTLYHGADAAIAAEQHFITMFQKKNIPDDIEEMIVENKEYLLVDLIAELNLSTSKSETRRMIQGGGVKIDGEKVNDPFLKIIVDSPKVLQLGKRKMIRLNSKK